MWSDDLHIAGIQTEYWNTLKKSLLASRNITDRTLDIKRKMAQVPPHPPKEIAEVRQELKRAKAKIKDIWDKHIAYRSEYLECKAAAIDLDKVRDPNKSSTLIQLIRHGEMRQLYRKCQKHLGKDIGQGLTELMVPLDPSELPKNAVMAWKRESNSKKVAKVILEQNERHFEESWDTPFATEALADLIGFDGTSPSANLIVSGDFDQRPNARSNGIHQNVQKKARYRTTGARSNGIYQNVQKKARYRTTGPINNPSQIHNSILQSP
jgi:hypothetical protein